MAAKNESSNFLVWFEDPKMDDDESRRLKRPRVKAEEFDWGSAFGGKKEAEKGGERAGWQLKNWDRTTAQAPSEGGPLESGLEEEQEEVSDQNNNKVESEFKAPMRPGVAKKRKAGPNVGILKEEFDINGNPITDGDEEATFDHLEVSPSSSSSSALKADGSVSTPLQLKAGDEGVQSLIDYLVTSVPRAKSASSTKYFEEKKKSGGQKRDAQSGSAAAAASRDVATRAVEHQRNQNELEMMKHLEEDDFLEAFEHTRVVAPSSISATEGGPSTREERQAVEEEKLEEMDKTTSQQQTTTKKKKAAGKISFKFWEHTMATVCCCCCCGDGTTLWQTFITTLMMEEAEDVSGGE